MSVPADSREANNRRVALVTGAARRIGKACAIELARRGFDIAAHANRSIDDARWLVDSLVAEHGVRAAAFQADLTVESAARDLVERSGDYFGRLDALVNSAAVWPSKPLEDVTAADVRRCLEANTVAVFAVAQAAGLRMVAQDAGGAVVNVGDAALAHDGVPPVGYAAYHPSKAAIPGLTRALAVELAERNPRVRVNAVLPGPVLCDTLPREPTEPDRRRRVVRSAALSVTPDDASGCGRAEHVAHAVAFLVENPFVCGVCLPVDGGGRLVRPTG